ncbi:hypothetical protein BJ138DRAFT_1000116 [Hygrophoropsis aurantiaca]|uniref:Uncharacterized protein n=1 Tax=Hygrophoropsis aurantiaca TaxID=72124 RepID=A0ACB8AMH1_9AGAM|nr:hypothetical protein BJ138DRAFT_1000116 [Hygrophoropsis aurantiaca]
MHLFTPNHVLLIAACYPPSSALLSAGPDYRPNAQELSRLTYYAANRPGKINKLGSELEKRVRNECHKAQYANTRARASLLITLAIVRALAVECRRDIALLSSSLVACLRITLEALSSDLEVCARAASLFTAWCTYTDGHVIGADAVLTDDYLLVLRKFASQSSAEIKSIDNEVRNRTRLVGLAALAGAVNSEALYSSSSQFGIQAAIIVRPLLFHVMKTEVSILEDRSFVIKENPNSPYLPEFRSRPATERRAASIHVHVDGESGPSSLDVLDASLRTLSHLLQHSNSGHVGFIMQAAFKSLDELGSWESLDQCRWFSQKTCEWTQYQYRYSVPTRLVEQLLETQDLPLATSEQKALASMVTAVFTSPTPLINLSTSDIISNLITLVFRRIAISPDDALLPFLVECIASLGTHVYYSDQIQDLASELVSRLVAVETQGVLGRHKDANDSRRSQAIRCLLAGLLGLMGAADGFSQNHEGHLDAVESSPRTVIPHPVSNSGPSAQDSNSRISRRTRVAADVWRETLSLLCDRDYAVRSDYANALVFYLRHEISKHGDKIETNGRRPRPLVEGSPPRQVNSMSLLLSGDSGIRSLHAAHAFIYMLATASSFGFAFRSSPSPSSSVIAEIPVIGVTAATPQDESGPAASNGQSSPTPSALNRRSTGPISRSRKASNAQHYLDTASTKVSSNAAASLADYALILHVLTAIHEEAPVRGLLAGIPMLLALDTACEVGEDVDMATKQRTKVIKEVLTRVWGVLGRVWNCPELVETVEKALSSFHHPPHLPPVAPFSPGVLRSADEDVTFPIGETELTCTVTGVNAEEAVAIIVSSRAVQEATGLDRQGLLRRFSSKWSADTALKDSVERPSSNRQMGEGSPLLKLSPALMAIENMSLQSLTRSVRGVGVTDLRDALEGRAGASNPALARPPSISTLDHTSSFDLGSNRLDLTRTRSRPKKRAVTSGAGEVRDVLNKLGIGKQNGNSLLKASFPSLHKPDQRYVLKFILMGSRGAYNQPIFRSSTSLSS